MLPWRRLFGGRTVRRRVQGVDLYMPWSHVLPDYARARTWYGQNLVWLAEALALRASAKGFRFVDLGANIGDSALQVLNRVEGRALCIEGDEHWARYLRMNVGADARITVEEVMLAPADLGPKGFRAVRRHGTTAFVPSDAGRIRSSISAEELRRRNPEFDDIRLIKSDTDGFDPLLVPEAARAWSHSGPVLFFEFDPALARKVAGDDPNLLWDELADLGYSRLAVWDNTGDPLGQLDVGEARDAAATLEPPPVELGYTFWDVAARRDADADAAAAFDALIDSRFDPAGAGALETAGRGRQRLATIK